MTDANNRIEVDIEALRTVLQALVGDPHLIREQQVLRDMDHKGICELSPIGQLIKDFNNGL